MKKIILCLVIAGGLLVSQVHAQVDPHFSQFYAYPMWLNPGMTGVMDGDYRVTGIYRKQWDGVAPYTTTGLSADVATSKNLNLGANFMSQAAGDAGYKYLTAYASIAYSGMKFGPDKAQQLTFGLQAGVLSRRIDPSRFQFGDQWNPVTGYNAALPTADVLSKTGAEVLDLGAGLSYWDGAANKTVNFYAGFSAFHLTQPEDPFISGAEKAKLPVRYAAHAGARIGLSEVFSIIPNIVYLRQGSAQEKMLGLSGQLMVNEATNLFFGTYYRVGDAFTTQVGVSYQQFVLGVGYDTNVSDLGKTGRGANSIEISVSYIGRGHGKEMKYLSCPRF